MGEPGFWDDPDAAGRVGAEHARTTRRLERWRGLASEVEDLKALAEMAEEDESVAAEVAGQMAGVTFRGFLGYPPETRLAIPLAPAYVALAVWLIVKGFPKREPAS